MKKKGIYRVRTRLKMGGNRMRKGDKIQIRIGRPAEMYQFSTETWFEPFDSLVKDEERLRLWYLDYSRMERIREKGRRRHNESELGSLDLLLDFSGIVLCWKKKISMGGRVVWNCCGPGYLGWNWCAGLLLYCIWWHVFWMGWRNCWKLRKRAQDLIC